jgi:hypothetical protein
MKTQLQIIAFVTFFVAIACQTTKDFKPVTLVKGGYVFQNGQWSQKDFYIKDQVLRFSSDNLIKDTLDAKGRYITPGFVDGHTHNLDRRYQHRLVNQYLSEGVLLVRNMTSKSKGVEAFRKHLDTVPSPRVLYSNWGFTSTLGHPFTAYEPYILGFYTPKEMKENAKTLMNSRKDLYNSYAFVDSIPQLKAIWPKFLETNPDLVKIYYFNEKDIETRNMGTYGLRYEVAKAIIDSAHQAGLKVHAHIGTAQEFEKMLDAGVDGFAHTPGFSWRGDSTNLSQYYLTDKMLKKASERDVILNPTAVINYARNKNDEMLLKKVAELQTDMIKRYRAYGGTIVPGTDKFGSTSKPMLDYYAQYINLPADDLVSIFTEEATEALLPDEKTGKLQEDYEASFLIFDQKPFENKTWNAPESVYLKGKKVK